VRIHVLYVSFCRLCLFIGGTKLILHGAERIEPRRAYVVVPNHESGWDPLCLLVGLPGLVIRFIAKQQFMRIPIVGQALRVTGNVRVVRTQTSGDAERIHAAMDVRDPAVSILFFAEGTRSRDGALHPFKMGAFVTALGYGLPILPIGIAGTRHIWERSVVRVRKGTVAVEVGKPVPIEGLTLEDRKLLRDRTFASVGALRARARQRLRDLGIDPGGIN
jgi:1-acyl-sn-glycerol-3-phosphate acyltransferase